jgi:hypothetical protein
VSRISIQSSNDPSTRGVALSSTQGSPIRIVWTGQEIERSKRTALRLTMQRTGRASMGYKVKERGVQFNVPKDRDGRGGNYLSSLLSKSSCDYDDVDIDMTYRMCCISVGNSPSYKAATLFDTGAHASFVNREVANWIEEHGRTDRQVSDRMRGWHEASVTTVSLAGTPMSSPILGSVVFDLTLWPAEYGVSDCRYSRMSSAGRWCWSSAGLLRPSCHCRFQ